MTSRRKNEWSKLSPIFCSCSCHSHIVRHYVAVFAVIFRKIPRHIFLNFHTCELSKILAFILLRFATIFAMKPIECSRLPTLGNSMLLLHDRCLPEKITKKQHCEKKGFFNFFKWQYNLPWNWVLEKRPLGAHQTPIVDGCTSFLKEWHLFALLTF